MTNADMPKVHEGWNVKHFREMSGISRGPLGEDWTRKKVSLLGQKETIEPAILEQVAKVLNLLAATIRNFDEEQTGYS